MIIAICGLQGSGKDTIGSYLINKYGFKKLSFAGVLKDIVGILFGWDREMLEGATKESREWREQVDPWWSQKLGMENLTPRYVLQYFGTDLFRTHFHSDIWVIAVERQLSKYTNCVITDCRFPNEIAMLRTAGATVIKVTRGELPAWYIPYESCQTIKPNNVHPSEYMWIREKFDYELENDSSIKDLEMSMDGILANQKVFNNKHNPNSLKIESIEENESEQDLGSLENPMYMDIDGKLYNSNNTQISYDDILLARKYAHAQSQSTGLKMFKHLDLDF